MSKSILVDKDILYSRLEKMIEIAENNSTSKKGIARMKEQRNNIHHALQDTNELLKALRNIGDKVVDAANMKLVRINETNEYMKLHKALSGNNED